MIVLYLVEYEYIYVLDIIMFIKCNELVVFKIQRKKIYVILCIEILMIVVEDVICNFLSIIWGLISRDKVYVFFVFNIC